jgi:hypothetical protein
MLVAQLAHFKIFITGVVSLSKILEGES